MDSDSKGEAVENQNRKYHEISIRIPSQHEELLSNYLILNVEGGNGLVMEDLDEEQEIRFYTQSEDSAKREIGKIKSFLEDSAALNAADIDNRISIRTVNEIDWVEQYQKMFEPVEVGEVVVKSVWSSDDFPGKTVIRLEPKMAFGTGKHETTQLCIDAIQRTVKENDTILDLGTGSGILSILAAKIGASEAFGLDIDIAAVENARENIELNHVADVVSIDYGSMSKVSRGRMYDVIISNLIREGIIELMADFVQHLEPGGTMILSGILTDQIDEMDRFFGRFDVEKLELLTMNEWACYILERRS